MGYDAHITRAHDWTESASAPISLQEWLTYVTSDPDFWRDGFAEATTPQGETIRAESEGLAVWTKHSKHGRDGNKAWFDWSEGRIVVKNPDEEILEKMRRIAKALGARVLGDDGESYDDAPPGPAARSTPWWKRLLGG